MIEDDKSINIAAIDCRRLRWDIMPMIMESIAS